MILYKRLISSYTLALSMAGLIVLSLIWVYPLKNSGMLVIIVCTLATLGLLSSINQAYHKGMEDKSAEIGDQQVRMFLQNARNASKRPPRLGKKVPSLSRPKRWNPEVHRHLRPVAK